LPIQHRLREVERLTLLGWTKPMIAAELDCSERQIGYDRAALREEYKQERLADQDEARDHEHRRLLVLYREAVDQFNKSKLRLVRCFCVTRLTRVLCQPVNAATVKALSRSRALAIQLF
jgi:hypothetical protein